MSDHAFVFGVSIMPLSTFWNCSGSVVGFLGFFFHFIYALIRFNNNRNGNISFLFFCDDLKKSIMFVVGVVRAKVVSYNMYLRVLP